MTIDSKRTIESYFEACNSGDRDLFFSLFEGNASHYLPKGMFGPIHDVQSLFNQWRRDAEENGAFWVLESVIAPEGSAMASAEWTAVKPAQHIHFRGVDVFLFSPLGRIQEVRVYYATARDPSAGHNELGGYDYASNRWYVGAVEGPA